ncbi:hypothetical protein RBI80_19715 [Klebsiella variicola]|nr:hypothetical protein RBI80_19715 [Klebsiella variicola]
MMDEKPKFLFFSGPEGIGRKTLVREVYKKLYRMVSGTIEVVVDEYASLDTIHSSLIKYTANWRGVSFWRKRRDLKKDRTREI